MGLQAFESLHIVTPPSQYQMICIRNKESTNTCTKKTWPVPKAQQAYKIQNLLKEAVGVSSGKLTIFHKNYMAILGITLLRDLIEYSTSKKHKYQISNFWLFLLVIKYIYIRCSLATAIFVLTEEVLSFPALNAINSIFIPKYTMEPI